jgi:hypothetical protein
MSLVSRRTRKLHKLSNTFNANDFSFLNPALLAREAITALPGRTVAARLVARNFNPSPAKFGDVLNIPRPGTFKMTRKDGVCDNIVTQDITGDRIQVRLDQWPQVAFKICDGEEDRPVRDLVEENLNPALDALAAGLDNIVEGQVHRVTGGESAGRLMEGTSLNINDFLIDARARMQAANAPENGRVMLLTSNTETLGLKNELFVRADQSGSTDALRRAAIKQLYNWDLFQPSNQPSIRNTQTKITGAVNMAGNAPAGTTVITFDAGSGTFTVGQWVRIAGDGTPQHITAIGAQAAGAGNFTISPGLKYDVADNAIITAIVSGAVNNVAGYRGRNNTTGVPGWAKEITVSGFSTAPQIGQGVTFGTQVDDPYSIIGVNGLVGITLDRPLETAIANTDKVNLLPAGEYNKGFMPNALALTVRPLDPPRDGSGAKARTMNMSGFSVRVTIAYDIDVQAHKVVLDFLAGINILNENLIIPMYA